MKKETIETIVQEQHQVPLFGYELLRKDLLPALLGKEHDKILYWAGKTLARQYPLPTLDDIIHFFTKSGWGQLTLTKEKKRELHFELTSEFFAKRRENYSCQLEAGFLAEQIQQQTNNISETDTVQKGTKVLFTVHIDRKDQVQSE
ncbi:YslB family protein [Anaerobacillus sp. MEB173]|uniref:YslB family protein n=1 Tax=Anaerobacillus sp. MEB173 TaxID=3383345 RepID=UPI003F900DFE